MSLFLLNMFLEKMFCQLNCYPCYYSCMFDYFASIFELEIKRINLAMSLSAVARA